MNITKAIELIAQERQEQINKHSRTMELDRIKNQEQQLRIAARKMLIKANGDLKSEEERREPPTNWDKDIWFKMITKPYKERMIIAGALIAAEIDRINEPYDY